MNFDNFYISKLTGGKSLLHITLGKNASVKGGLGGDPAHQCCGYGADGTIYIRGWDWEINYCKNDIRNNELIFEKNF